MSWLKKAPKFGAAEHEPRTDDLYSFEVFGRKVTIYQAFQDVVVVATAFYLAAPVATVAFLKGAGALLLGATIFEAIEFEVALFISEHITGGSFHKIIGPFTDPFYTVEKVLKFTYQIDGGDSPGLFSFFYNTVTGAITVVPGGLGSVGADP